MEDFYVYSSSKDNIVSFPSDNCNDFHVLLAERIILKGNNWYCALKEIEFNVKIRNEQNTTSFLVLTDINDVSYFKNTKAPILRKIFLNKKQRCITYDAPLYVPVKVCEFNAIRFYLKTTDTWDSAFYDAGVLGVTLHFRRFQQRSL